MINRVAVTVKSKEPFIEWVNSSDPYNDNPGMTIESVNEDNNVYLIDDRYAERFEDWLKKNYRTIFEIELNDWYTDPSLWPQKRDLRTFRKWFSIECNSVVYDLGRGGIYDDEEE